MTITSDVADPRTREWLADATEEVGAAWGAVQVVSQGQPPPMGLASGDRPTADVEVLAGLVASAEYALAAWMNAAAAAGALPIPQPGGLLTARGWGSPWAKRLARAGQLAGEHPALASAWAAGLITSDHLDPLARLAQRLSPDELAATIAELNPLWGQISPSAVARFVADVVRMLHPPEDPDPDETAVHASRGLSFALTRDSVVLSGEIPRVEGELVMAAIDAVAERLRSEADNVPAAARRADALVQLVGDAHAADVLPTRGGLPVSLSVTLERTRLGDDLWVTSRGHRLTEAEARFCGCDAAVTPILVDRSDARGSTAPTIVPAAGLTTKPEHQRPAVRIAALAAALLGSTAPLEVGRTARTASPAQRRALAARDRGCVIPGCGIPAEACQAHHLTEWADGGCTDIDNLVLLCWAHHRQVDLRMWTIEATDPHGPPPRPPSGAPPGAPWPANNGAPFRIVRTPRNRWRT